MCVCESLTGSKWRRLVLCERKSLGAAGRERVVAAGGRRWGCGLKRRDTRSLPSALRADATKPAGPVRGFGRIPGLWS